ncbi:MAG: AIR synthase family protein [Candidatus Bathyarchaeota archaeon]|nr:AIR synthase family protein [Candidatus Bathyarchaeota archaeon]
MPKLTRLPTGKVPKDVLKRLVFTHLGAPSDRVLKGPHVGEDAALIDMDDRILIAKANPITGAESRIGWLTVHINANDVAVRGAEPKWFLSVILLPEGSDESLLETIMVEMHEACMELGVSIIGGHTEVALGLTKPIVSGFMLGEVSKERCITTGGAKTGDKIILTKGVAIEGTGILAEDLKTRLQGRVDDATLERASKMLDMISVVPEALKACSIGGVNSIHTPTEGGVLNGLLEISEASGLGFKLNEDKLLISDETSQICEALGIDPLRLLSSGSLLIVVEPGMAEKVITGINEIGVDARIIGEISSDPEEHLIIQGDGKVRSAGSVDQDELFRVLEEQA